MVVADLPEQLDATAGDDHRVALGVETLGQPEPDARRTARNENGVACRLHGSTLPLAGAGRKRSGYPRTPAPWLRVGQPARGR